MTLPGVAAARRFDARAHLPFLIGSERVGWIRLVDAPLLERWPDVFVLDEARIELASALGDPDSRSVALGKVINTLAAEGHITGWRNETYAIRNRFDAPPLAFIERAASRFFGTMTYAVHLNGIVHEPGHPPQLWIARRSDTKATDPGMLDNIVAGGIGWGLGIEDTLVKECAEEAGIDTTLASRAQPGRSVLVQQSLPEGAQVEQIFVYDLELPADFVPRNQDGEVAGHRLASIDEVMEWITQGAMTVDASLATLDGLLRHGWIDGAVCQGFAALLGPAA